MKRKVQWPYLLALAGALDVTPAENFNINTWKRENCTIGRNGQHHCGTVACAIGWAGVYGILPPNMRLSIGGTPIWTDPETGDTEENFRAVAKGYGISVRKAEELFSLNGYAAQRKTKPKTVARAIRRFAREQGAL